MYHPSLVLVLLLVTFEIIQCNRHWGHQYFSHYHDVETIWIMTTAPEEQGLISVPSRFVQKHCTHCTLFGALNGSRIRITSPLFTQQPLESSVVEGLGLFQLLSLPLLYMEQRQSSDGGSNRESTRCFGKKRRTSWGFRVKQRERGRMVTTSCRLHSCQC